MFNTLKQLSRCLENRTRTESSMSEILDEEVDYGSFLEALPIHPPIQITHENDSQHLVARVYRLVKPEERR